MTPHAPFPGQKNTPEERFEPPSHFTLRKSKSGKTPQVVKFVKTTSDRDMSRF